MISDVLRICIVDAYKWDPVVLRTAQELARYPLGKSKELGFVEPRPRPDWAGRLWDAKAHSAVESEWARTLGIGKSTLHYLRKHARSSKPFEGYGKVAEKLKLSSVREG